MLDFDGTLYPYATAVALAVAHLSGGKVAPDPAVLPDYDLVSSWGRKFGMTAALWDEAHLLIARDSAFHDMEPIPGSAAAVRRFRSAGGTVVIQTVRAGFTSERPHARPDDGARIAAATEQWACDWFAVPPDAVIHVSTAGRKGRSHLPDSQAHRRCVFVDDAAGQIVPLRQAGETALVCGHAYNRGIAGPRFDGWAEFDTTLAGLLGLPTAVI